MCVCTLVYFAVQALSQLLSAKKDCRVGIDNFDYICYDLTGRSESMIGADEIV